MRHCARHLLALLLAALLAVAPCHAAAQSALADLLKRAAEMTDAGKHAEAYALLSAEEDTYIGEIAYDYALGRAALYAGRPDRATLAFARVLALDPGHAGALIDSGRAYLALGNRAQAEAAFESLLALDPPPAIRAQLLVYLAQARSAERTAGVALRGHLTVAAGTSTNVNQAPSQGPIFVPGLPGLVQLADQNVRKDDSFASLGGGLEGAMQLRERLSLIGSAEFLARANAHESDFDVGGLAGSAGLAWSGERYLVRGQVQLLRNTLGGSTSRDVKALSLDVSEATSPKPGAFGVLFGFAHLGAYRHPRDDLRIYDADFVSLGGGVTTRFDEKSTMSVALVTGMDDDQGGNPSGDRLGVGARLAWERILSPTLKLALIGSWVKSTYSAVDTIFLVKREDTRLDFEGFLRYQLAPKLEARLGAWRSVQDSNVPIYEYSRTDWWVSLTRLFD
jgi:tetratricopeptide (TPR) repeat protein